MNHSWTDEEKEYIKDICFYNTRKEIQEALYNKFNIKFTIEQIKGVMQRNNLKIGEEGLKKTRIPWNKGTKGICKANSGSFKKGRPSYNEKETGHEIITKDGYVKVKVKDPNVWKLKHRIVWESYYGPVPANHVVIFADRDKRNFNIDNLILVTRSELMKMNWNSLLKYDPKLTKLGLMVAKVIIKAEERKEIIK
ncbi:MAG: HNH endonuclease [Fusobacterium necrophorum]|nr:HNH endonuclease [Fusobacterium necrophorum]